MTWIIDNASALTVIGQRALLITFLIVSASGERRRTGLILASYAALYLGLIPLNTLMDDISPPFYALLYAVLDASCARLLWLYGDKGSRPQIVLLYSFVTCHIMAWAYASGYPSLLDPTLYVVICFALICLQIIVAIPAIWDGVHEGFEMVKEKLARYSLSRERAPAYLSGVGKIDPASNSTGHSVVSGDPGRSGVRDVFQGSRLSGEDL